MEQVLRNTKMEHCITEQNTHLATMKMTDSTFSIKQPHTQETYLAANTSYTYGL